MISGKLIFLEKFSCAQFVSENWHLTNHHWAINQFRKISPRTRSINLLIPQNHPFTKSNIFRHKSDLFIILFYLHRNSHHLKTRANPPAENTFSTLVLRNSHRAPSSIHFYGIPVLFNDTDTSTSITGEQHPGKSLPWREIDSSPRQCHERSLAKSPQEALEQGEGFSSREKDGMGWGRGWVFCECRWRGMRTIKMHRIFCEILPSGQKEN